MGGGGGVYADFLYPVKDICCSIIKYKLSALLILFKTLANIKIPRLRKKKGVK